MRLLYVSDARLPNLAANTVQIMKMCSAFAEAGCEVTLAARVEQEHDPRAGECYEELFHHYAVKPNFRIVRLPRLIPGQSRKDPWAMPHSLSALWLATRHRDDYDLVYTRLALAATLCAKNKLPVGYESHRPLSENGRISKRVRKSFVAAAQKDSFRGMVSISQQLADLYWRDGFPQNKTLIAHDAVDLDRFTPRLNKEEARKQLRLPADKAIVGYCGHLYTGRGTGELLRCAERMKDILFLFVGGSEEEVERYRARAWELNLNNVLFVGHVPNADVPRYLMGADVLAMPYTSATGSAFFMSPMKMFEYLAAGRPIVASDFPSIREVLSDGRNAILVRPDCVEALIDGINRALQPQAAALAEQAASDAGRYTWTGRAQTILSFLKQK